MWKLPLLDFMNLGIPEIQENRYIKDKRTVQEKFHKLFNVI